MRFVGGSVAVVVFNSSDGAWISLAMKKYLLLL